MGLLLLVLSLGGQARSQPAEPAQADGEAEFTFRVPVDVVVVRAIVTDRGKPVTDLAVGDFTIFEDGKPLPIQSFTRESYEIIRSHQPEVEPERAPADATDAEAKRAPVAGPAADRPHFISLVIDDITSPSHGALKRAVDAVGKFVEEHLQPGDRVAMVAASGKFHQPFTADRQRLLQAVRLLPRKLNRRQLVRSDCPAIDDLQAQRIYNETDPLALETAISEKIFCNQMVAGGVFGSSQGGRDQNPRAFRNTNMLSLNLTQGNSEQRRNAEVVVRAQASRIHRENEYWSRNLLDTLQQHLRSLQHFDGRKSLVLVSDGFLAQQLRYEMQGVVRAALRSGTILSTVDMRGLYTTSYRASEVAALATEATLSQMSMRVENMRVQSQPLAQMALETGGIHFHNNNDLFGGLKTIADSQSFYYVLTYASPATASDGRFHRIKVNVSRPGLKITHRKGYFAPKEDPTYIALKKREVLDALRAPGNLNEIPVRLSYNAFPVGEDRYQVDVFTRIDFERLPFLEEKDRKTNLLHLITVAYREDGGYLGGQEKQLDLRLTRSGQQDLAALGATSKTTLEVPSGAHQLKAVVRESVEAVLGSVQERIVLARRLTAGKPSGPKYRLLSALAAPDPSGAIPLRFTTYTFYPDPKRALVRLSAQARLPEDGVLGVSASEPLQVMGVAIGEDGEIASLFGGSVGAEGAGGKVRFGGRMKLPPGRYRLKLAVADIGGRVGTAEQDLLIPELPEDRLATSSLVAAREMQAFPPSVFAVQVKLTDELDPFIHQGLQIRAPASRRFNRGEPLIVFYRLYNLAAEDGRSPLMARVSLVGESGGSKEFPPVVLNEGVEAATQGEAGVAFQLPTGDLAPGKYSLRVETRNLSGSRTVLARSESIELLPREGEGVAANLEGNGPPAASPSLDLPKPEARGVQEGIDLLAIAGAEDPAQRVGLIEAFLARHPESDRVGELRRQATWLYWQLNRFQMAIQHGEASLSDSPSDPQVLTILATAYHALDEPAQAIRRASRAVRSLRGLDRPGHMDAERWQSRIDDLMSQNYAYMGSAYLSQYETDRRNPASQNAGLNLQKAHLYSTRAVELAPRSDFAQFQLGIVFCARNDVVAAIQPLAKAVVLNGRFGDIARENLESVYRLIHQGSLDGLENLLAQARLDLANGKRSSL